MKIEYKILDARIGDSIPFPDYATPGSAAIDLRAVFAAESMVIQPQETKLIGTGIAFYIGDPSYCGIVLPRSGLGYKHGIVLGNLIGLIDSDYQGELKVPLWNRSQTPYTLTLGERMAQFMMMPVVQGQFLQVEAFSDESARGTGGFGHTGNQ